MGDWESQRKAILPYLQRASEIENVDRKVAYYCRLYAVEQGIKLEQRDQKADDLLELVLNQLEKDKPLIELDQQADREHCEKFALNILVKAKKRDEQGISDRDTAKAYYAAFNFVEILKQFGKLSTEIERERRFAVFRAAEIKKALDDQRPPPPLIPSQVPVNQPTSAEQKETYPPPNTTEDQDIGLIDYDPGYVEGSKVVFVQHETGSMNSGVITGKAQLVGGFFTIQAVDNGVFNLGALFLAPDLSEGEEVTYFYPDGRQENCLVLHMNVSKWPPKYTIQMNDESQKEVNHSQFVLNSVPVSAEEPTVTTPDLPQATVAVLSIPPPSAFSEHPNSSVEPATPVSPPVVPGETQEKARNRITSQASWLKRRGRANSSDSAADRQNSVSQSIQSVDSAHTPSTVDNSAMTEVGSQTYSNLPQKQPSIRHSSSDGGNKQLPTYYDVINEESRQYEYSDESYIHRQPFNRVSGATTGNPQWSSSYQPSQDVIQQAIKCTQNANTALNFNDVDHAMSCLHEALALLEKKRSSTHPSQ